MRSCISALRSDIITKANIKTFRNNLSLTQSGSINSDFILSELSTRLHGRSRFWLENRRYGSERNYEPPVKSVTKRGERESKRTRDKLTRSKYVIKSEGTLVVKKVLQEETIIYRIGVVQAIQIKI